MAGGRYEYCTLYEYDVLDYCTLYAVLYIVPGGRGGGCPIILAKFVVSERELGLPAQRTHFIINTYWYH